MGGCGAFTFLVAKRATPKVKSQVSRRAYVSCIYFGVYIRVSAHTHTKMGIKRVYVTASDMCMHASVQRCRVGASEAT